MTRRYLYLALILALQLTKTDSRCNHICLSWTFKNNELVLSCRPESEDKSHFRITFYHRKKKAFCVPSNPSADCRTHVASSVITQNNITKETFLRVYGKSLTTANGLWMCTFGQNIVNATTEVTIPDNNSGFRCWKERLFWVLFLFVTVLGVILAILYIFSKIRSKRMRCLKVVVKRFSVSKRWKVIFTSIGFVLLVPLPILIGYIDHSCKAKGVSSVIGILMGFSAGVMLGPKDNQRGHKTPGDDKKESDPENTDNGDEGRSLSENV